MIKGFFVFCLLFFSVANISAQQPTIDSLRREEPLAKNDTIRLILLTSLAEAFTEGKPDSAYYFGKELLSLSQKLKFKLNEAYALDQMAYALLNMGNYARSLQTFLSAQAIAEDPKSEQNILPEKYLNLKVFLKKPVTPHMLRMDILARVYHYIGILYGTTNHFDKELYYYFKSKQLTEEIGNKSELCTIYSTMGRSYISVKKLDSAWICEEKAYSLAMETGNKKYLGSILLNEGRIQSSLEKKQIAIEYFRRAKLASMDQNYFRGVVACDLFLSDLFRAAGQTDSSFQYANSALEVAKYINVPVLLLRSYNALASFYRFSRNKDSTVKYQDLIIKMNDSIFNAKQLQLFQNIDFDEQQRQQEIKLAKEAYQNRFRTYSLLAGLAIFISVAIILWRNSLQRRKANVLLLQQKDKVESALTELKATQKQLIQSEKMASLGELTAGVAHEIQNPLNFVNNFSELNRELIVDMKNELRANNREDAISIADNIDENEQKINHHGKRADAIVRNMLQHSMAGTQQKEPTEINALADEYLRLSYSGLKAKDKTFNATISLNFDASIGKIDITRQDFSRMLLNIYTNAFYSVIEKKKKLGDEYEPAISVNTIKMRDKIEIKVRDNGMGIPEKVKDKIFQPFFTTKPTGQGTGLGLSLAYDIIKAHGGEIRLDTQEGEYATFIIVIPV